MFIYNINTQNIEVLIITGCYRCIYLFIYLFILIPTFSCVVPGPISCTQEDEQAKDVGELQLLVGFLTLAGVQPFPNGMIIFIHLQGEL